MTLVNMPLLGITDHFSIPRKDMVHIKLDETILLVSTFLRILQYKIERKRCRLDNRLNLDVYYRSAKGYLAFVLSMPRIVIST